MRTSKSDIQSSGRIRELQDKFRELEPELEDSNIKEALSIINGMIQELMRSTPDHTGNDVPEKNIAKLYKNAPRMEDAAVCKPLPEGAVAPDFALRDATGETITLSDFRGSTVLLVFYPLDWSPGCSQQLDVYQHEYDEFSKRSIEIIGISVDSIYSHGAWSAVRGLKMTLLSDFNPKGETAAKYKVYREQDGFSERALFIIDKDGIIKYSYVSPYLNHIPDIYQLFEKLDNVMNVVSV
ncbi:MAG TPA: peroxiredoxin [Bacteroidales bacterium]|nr:peroxiredoxin [Bacteroidales bacterium]